MDADWIVGGAGDNVIFGELGEDVIAGGSGNDQISGGWGYDTVSGGGGTNYIVYNRANDTYVKSGGHDIARSALAVSVGSTILQTHLSSPMGQNLAARMMSAPPASVTWLGQPHVEPRDYVAVTPESIQAGAYPGFGSPAEGTSNGDFFSAASVPPVQMPPQTFVQKISWLAPVLPPLAPAVSGGRGAPVLTEAAAPAADVVSPVARTTADTAPLVASAPVTAPEAAPVEAVKVDAPSAADPAPEVVSDLAPVAPAPVTAPEAVNVDAPSVAAPAPEVVSDLAPVASALVTAPEAAPVDAVKVDAPSALDPAPEVVSDLAPVAPAPVTAPEAAPVEAAQMNVAQAPDQASPNVDQAMSLPPVASNAPTAVAAPALVIASGLAIGKTATITAPPPAAPSGAAAARAPASPQGQNTGFEMAPVVDPVALGVVDPGMGVVPIQPVFGLDLGAPIASALPVLAAMDAYRPAEALGGGIIISTPLPKPPMDDAPSSPGVIGSPMSRFGAAEMLETSFSSGIVREVVPMDRLIRAIRESEITVRMSGADLSHDDGAVLRVFDETRGLFVARSMYQASFVIDLGPDPVMTELDGPRAQEGGLMELEECAMIVPSPSWLSVLKRFGRW